MGARWGFFDLETAAMASEVIDMYEAACILYCNDFVAMTKCPQIIAVTTCSDQNHNYMLFYDVASSYVFVLS